jgi:prepilin-type N-terminal cleavage/methylation domain-containing protein
MNRHTRARFLWHRPHGPAPPDARPAQPSGGFTLLELILVLLVIGVGVAVSVPSLSRGRAALHLRAAGRDLYNVLRYARELAITEQREIRFVAARQARQVMLTDELGEGARTYALPGDVDIHRLFLGREEILEGPLVIRFLPNGSSEPATIVLRSERGAVLRIVTDPITGGASLITSQEGEGP